MTTTGHLFWIKVYFQVSGSRTENSRPSGLFAQNLTRTGGRNSASLVRRRGRARCPGCPALPARQALTISQMVGGVRCDAALLRRRLVRCCPFDSCAILSFSDNKNTELMFRVFVICTPFGSGAPLLWAFELLKGHFDKIIL